MVFAQIIHFCLLNGRMGGMSVAHCLRMASCYGKSDVDYVHQCAATHTHTRTPGTNNCPTPSPAKRYCCSLAVIAVLVASLAHLLRHQNGWGPHKLVSILRREINRLGTAATTTGPTTDLMHRLF